MLTKQHAGRLRFRSPGLERQTRPLTRSAVSMIEDTICLSHVKSRYQEEADSRPSRSPIHNLELVTFALNGR